MARSAHREAVGYCEQALSVLRNLPGTRATREQAVDLQVVSCRPWRTNISTPPIRCRAPALLR